MRKRLKIVNFTYTILNEKDVAMGEKGNYILAIIKTTERRLDSIEKKVTFTGGFPKDKYK